MHFFFFFFFLCAETETGDQKPETFLGAGSNLGEIFPYKLNSFLKELFAIYFLDHSMTIFTVKKKEKKKLFLAMKAPC